MKKILVIFMCLLLFGCNNGQFEDEYLNLAVNQTLRTEGLRDNQLDELKHLDVSYMNISSLEGIEKLVNLESLNISNNVIVDIGRVSELTKLEILDLQNNAIEDVTSLSNLESLEVLLLRGNPITDLSILRPIIGNLKTTDFLVDFDFPDEKLNTHVKELIGESQISYYDLEQIVSLDLLGLDIESLSGIEHMKNLEELKLEKVTSGLENIRKLTNLRYLTIRDSNLESISLISELTDLVYLDLKGNKIRDIGEMSSDLKLKYLDLSYNRISDIGVLNQYIYLKSLYLDGNYIESYASIDSLLGQVDESDIYIVYFNDSNLELAVRDYLRKETGFITLRELESIRSLNASGFGISDLGGIDLLSNLIELDITSNSVSDLDPLTSLDQLQILKAKDNQIADLQPLVYLKAISILDLSENVITSVDPLLFLSNLKYCFLSGNEIEESTVTEELKSKLQVTDEW
jgi:Leucine-rich repeat (LRR) protein